MVGRGNCGHEAGQTTSDYHNFMSMDDIWHVTEPSLAVLLSPWSYNPLPFGAGLFGQKGRFLRKGMSASIRTEQIACPEVDRRSFHPSK
jgi:hypothetical protein